MLLELKGGNPFKARAYFNAARILEAYEGDLRDGVLSGDLARQKGIGSHIFEKIKEFPFAFHHFTGSKEHNAAMRSRAKKIGLKLNEYGLFRGDKLIPCPSEEKIFVDIFSRKSYIQNQRPDNFIYFFSLLFKNLKCYVTCRSKTHVPIQRPIPLPQPKN